MSFLIPASYCIEILSGAGQLPRRDEPLILGLFGVLLMSVGIRRFKKISTEGDCRWRVGGLADAGLRPF